MMPLADDQARAAPRRESVWRPFESCATAMIAVDRALQIVFCNEAAGEWLGDSATRARVDGLAMLDARPPMLADAAARAANAQRRVWLRDARLRGAFGNRSVDLALTPFDAAHLLIEMHAAAADPAPSRWSESLRGFAHEVRGPLAGVRGAAQLLKRHAVAPDQVELAELIVTEVDRLATLSDRLLHAGGKPRLAHANIHEIVERVIALIAAELPQLEVRRDYDPSLPSLPIDADRIQQALLNLVRNARDANAKGISLRTRADRSARIGDRMLRAALRIDVGDDGDGVPSALAESLFEPLVSGRDGSGLGLAIAREIAREHGGDVVYASRPGATTFSLLLPLAT